MFHTIELQFGEIVSVDKTGNSLVHPQINSHRAQDNYVHVTGTIYRRQHGGGERYDAIAKEIIIERKWV